MEEQNLLKIDFSTASKELIQALIEESEDPSVFTEIVKTNMNRPEILMLLDGNPDTPDEAKKLISDALHMPVTLKGEAPKVKKSPEMRSLTLLQRIQRLSFGEKRLLGLRGGKEVRSILMKDPNREIVLTVLENPKITETEIEIIAKSRSAPEEVIRKIVRKREWMKNYNIILSLLTNPKLPTGIALPLVSELKTRDLAMLEKNRNVSEGLRGTAKKLLKARKAH